LLHRNTYQIVTNISQSHAFSTKALLTQEDVILRFADDLNKAIKERGPLTPINLVEFFNWTTFDGNVQHL
jgi:hypothetical protein